MALTLIASSGERSPNGSFFITDEILKVSTAGGPRQSLKDAGCGHSESPGPGTYCFGVRFTVSHSQSVTVTIAREVVTLTPRLRA